MLSLLNIIPMPEGMSLLPAAAAAILTAVIAYLLGSINPAIIITRICIHKDIRDFGSGNAGMTNVLRTVGLIPGIITFICDIAKGVIAVILGGLLFTYLGGYANPQLGAYTAGIFVMAGHLFPIYYHFKGGKGISTYAGILAVIDWRVMVIGLSIFLIILLITKYVSLGSIFAAISTPISTFVLHTVANTSPFSDQVWDTVFSLILAAVTVAMHHENIKRLIHGNERKITVKLPGKSKKDSTETPQ